MVISMTHVVLILFGIIGNLLLGILIGGQLAKQGSPRQKVAEPEAETDSSNDVAAPIIGKIRECIHTHSQWLEDFAHLADVAADSDDPDNNAKDELVREGMSNKWYGQLLDGWSNQLETCGAKKDRVRDLMARLTNYRATVSDFDGELARLSSDSGQVDIRSLLMLTAKLLDCSRNVDQALMESHKDTEEVYRQRIEAAERDARIDSMTQVGNRRSFDERLKEIHSQFQRQRMPFQVTFIDVDRFKLVNDTFGHATGDEVLKNIGEILRTCFRDNDVAFRIGGEEFAVISTCETLDGAFVLAERFRQNIDRAKVTVDGKDVNFTASVGVAEIKPNESVGELIGRVDKALYEAKRRGRNQTFVSGLQKSRDSMELSQAENAVEGNHEKQCV